MKNYDTVDPDCKLKGPACSERQTRTPLVTLCPNWRLLYYGSTFVSYMSIIVNIFLGWTMNSKRNQFGGGIVEKQALLTNKCKN